MKYPLKYLTFEVTRECNLGCLFCYNHWRRDNSKQALSSYSQANKTLKKLFKIASFEHITFTGGEPFLADGLNELVLDCRMQGKSVTIISNGTTGSESDYKILKDLGVSLFELPLHSDRPEIHDYLTNTSGSFRQVLTSIHSLFKIQAEIVIVFVLTKKNMDDLKNTLNFAEQLGVKRFMLARFNIGGRGIKHCPELLPTVNEFRNAFNVADDFAGSHKMKITANVCVPFCILKPGDYSNIRIVSCGTHFSERPITIDYEGNVRMCNHSPRVIGNIHRDPMEVIFSSEYVKSWDSSIPVLCSKCSEWSNCRGGCRAASEQIGLTLHDEDPIIRMTKINRQEEKKESRYAVYPI